MPWSSSQSGSDYFRCDYYECVLNFKLNIPAVVSGIWMLLPKALGGPNYLENCFNTHGLRMWNVLLRKECWYQNAHFMDVLSYVCFLWIFLLPHFKQVVRPLSFPCLREFLQDSLNKNCSKSMIFPVICKCFWQINLHLQEEGGGGWFLVDPQLRVWSLASELHKWCESLSHPMAITGEVDGLQGDGLWGPLKICLSARVWAQHIVLGAARERGSLSGGRGESIFCLGSRTEPSCLKAVGYKKCTEFMPEFSFQNA